MSPEPLVTSRVIELALAPVFLLSGIAGLLTVMTGRLARIMDRGRQLTEGPSGAVAAGTRGAAELADLELRRHFAAVALMASAVSALITCVVIGALFGEALLGRPLTELVDALFTLAVLALMVSLTYFMREVHLAMHSVRIEVPKRGGAA